LYMDNIPMFFAPSWRFNGDKWVFNSHNVPGAYVSRDDCGRVLGALLMGKGEPNKVYEVTGPKAVTDREVFNWICAQSGYKGQFVDMPDAELRKFWLDKGLPLDVYGDFSNLPMKLCIGDLLCCGEMLARGDMKETTDTVEKLTGRKPIPFQEGLLKYKDAQYGVAAA
jgi:NAD(P)H dehydrogenase (quinone)